MITEFIAHLGTELIVVDGYVTVAHAWDVEPFNAPEQVDLPAALVFRGTDSSEDSSADNRTRQRTTTEVYVYTVCAHADLEDLRTRLFNAALGWQASAEWSEMEHSRGQVTKLSGDKIWWLDVFQTWRINSQQ